MTVWICVSMSVVEIGAGTLLDDSQLLLASVFPPQMLFCEPEVFKDVWQDEIYQDRREEESEKETDVFYEPF